MAKKASEEAKVKAAPAPEIAGNLKLAIMLAAIGVVLAVIIIAFSAGSHGKTPQPAQQLAGSDRDAHGCIPSAGYVWCESKGKCLRTWEEECLFAQAVSSDRDEHGCIPSAGYVWCQESRKCSRPWEENCSSYVQTAQAPAPANGKSLPGLSSFDSNGCMPTAGYVWCQEKNKCLRLWEENCSEGSIVGGNADPHGCTPTAGYVWCEGLQACILPWETPCNSTVNGNTNSTDENGCNVAEGYTWCEAKQLCLRLWEDNCTIQVANETDVHGCVLSQGYLWCEAKQRCIRPFEEDCTTGAEEEANLHCDGFSKVYFCGSYIKVVSAIAGNGSIFYKSGFAPVECEGTPSPDYMKPICRILMDNCGAERRVC